MTMTFFFNVNEHMLSAKTFLFCREDHACRFLVRNRTTHQLLLHYFVVARVVCWDLLRRRGLDGRYAKSFGSTKKGMTLLDSPYVIHLVPSASSFMETRMRCAQPYHGTGQILTTLCPSCDAQCGSTTFLTWRKVFNLPSCNSEHSPSKESTFQQVKTYLRLCR